MSKFPASLFKVAIDRDGEARIQLDVPAEALNAILPLVNMTGTLLDVEITPAKE